MARRILLSSPGLKDVKLGSGVADGVACGVWAKRSGAAVKNRNRAQPRQLTARREKILAKTQPFFQLVQLLPADGKLGLRDVGKNRQILSITLVFEFL